MSAVADEDGLRVEAAVFKLTTLCFPLCYADGLYASAKNDGCFFRCVGEAVDAREWTKSRFQGDYQQLLEENKRLFRSL